jgi:molybdate transport system substrate-binding protein
LRAIAAGSFAGTAIALLSCTGSPPPDPPLRVSAASSLVDVVPELIAGFLATSGEAARVETNYASSSLLARQIERGAPADVFIAADERWLDHLDRRDLLAAGTRMRIAGNRLVVIVPAGEGETPAPTRDVRIGDPLPAELALGTVAIGDPEHVPVGRYAREALDALGWWISLSGRVVPALDARAVLALVARGEVAAGVVYATDAVGSASVRVIARLPQSTHGEIVYGAAGVVGSSPVAHAFVRFLATDGARAILERHGFAEAP